MAFPNILSTGCTPSRRAAAQSPPVSAPLLCSSTLQVLPVYPIIHDAVTSVRVPWENRWLPPVREIPGGLFTKGNCLQKGGRWGTSGRGQDSRTWGSSYTSRAGGEREGMPPANESPQERPDLESNDTGSGNTVYPRTSSGGARLIPWLFMRALHWANPLGLEGQGP